MKQIFAQLLPSARRGAGPLGMAALGLAVALFALFPPALAPGQQLIGMNDFPKPTHAQLARGKIVYNGICAPCHGRGGRGDGPIAANLLIKPRDFTQGTFKNRSTASGQLPTDFDIVRTVANGVHGAAMPPFQSLDPQDNWDVVQFVKKFSPKFSDSTEYPLTVLDMSTPIPFSANSIARGRAVYIKAQCWNCHGAYARGNGPASPTLMDQWGNREHARNLTDPSDYRFALSRNDVYRIFSTGLNGTPMPSFYSAFSDSSRWDLANYVWSLRGGNEYLDGKTLDELVGQNK